MTFWQLHKDSQTSQKVAHRLQQVTKIDQDFFRGFQGTKIDKNEDQRNKSEPTEKQQLLAYVPAHNCPQPKNV